jgi:hypothetical protein
MNPSDSRLFLRGDEAPPAERLGKELFIRLVARHHAAVAEVVHC